jgi:hypothetical protein
MAKLITPLSSREEHPQQSKSATHKNHSESNPRSRSSRHSTNDKKLGPGSKQASVRRSMATPRTGTPQNDRAPPCLTINSNISTFDIDALPTCRSRHSMNRPPPPPPRDSKGVDPNIDKSLSKAFQLNRMDSLPFRSVTVPAPPPLRISRRYSALETKEFQASAVGPPTSQFDDPIPSQDRRLSVYSGARSNCVPAPPPPLLKRRQSTQASAAGPCSSQFDDPILSQDRRISLYSGACSDYNLGDEAKCPSHMIIQDCPQAAFDKVSRLKQHNFAFVRRTDASWTYAILADRHVDDSRGDNECMMFVLNQTGLTKTIKRDRWASFVRVVAEEELPEEQLDPSVPSQISLDCCRDDCSMISFVSC